MSYKLKVVCGCCMSVVFKTVFLGFSCQEVIGMFIVQSVWRRSADRIPVGARFSSPVQTGCGTYPASCTMGTGYLCRPGHGFDHPPLPTAEVKETVELNLYFRSGPSWSVLFPYGARSFKFCTTSKPALGFTQLGHLLRKRSGRAVKLTTHI